MTLRWILAGTALANAVLAGFYFAYATVISAQRSAEPAQAAAAMVRMNQSVERAPFLLLFALAALGGLVSAVWSLAAGHRSGAALLGAGGGVAAVLAAVTTIAVNVPLNTRIEAGTASWSEFVATWGPWNAGRAALCALAALGALAGAWR
ncbi:DUF1772 domain-containing protein [Tsukamurella sp. 8F]|uniref:anthrone oxygenase family protein n=1 Tax=unclassified Tsukamurella TaxID=2633480 RepID=UPI0023B8A382|nr:MULTISPECIES: anthrone oxygenase family protein [unclassified Tsukamurella]MDF0530144.1 DUF1772 domain-containing protein [Tsukamurella sp. 8J]MDF0586462.1 DUF1772 domain-containing protein [Tsukamurella sp. 8F]